jgi:hypothetical protein
LGRVRLIQAGVTAGVTGAASHLEVIFLTGRTIRRLATLPPLGVRV